MVREVGRDVVRIGGVEVGGRGLDHQGRCSHYGSSVDILSVRHHCCGRFYACHRCHDDGEDHPSSPWPTERFDEPAVLCGACGSRLPIREYLDSHEECARCGAAFNPGCAHHHPIYFQV